MYAVIETGGKQYRISEGDVIRVEKLPAEVGADVAFDRVLLVGGEDGVRVGTPVLEGARVSARVVEQDRGRKIIVFKKRRRKNYSRTQGHRQDYTGVRIERIQG